MKKALFALAFAGLASSAFAQNLIGSSHDLSAATGPGTYPGGTLSACQYCHAPHRANISIAGTPLWNRNAPAGPFVMYTSNTIDGAVAATPNANSATCLSCHDGQSDMGATFVTGNGFPTPPTQMAAGNRVVGLTLGDDHPVSVRYAQIPADFQAVGAVTTAGLTLYGTAGNETVECGSCHDPHDLTFANFLKADPATICTDCHIK